MAGDTNGATVSNVAKRQANAENDDAKYQADGTIHVHFGSSESGVTFIPDQHVEQGGCKFVAFVPWRQDGESDSDRDGLVKKACGPKGASKGVPLRDPNKLACRLLEVAVKATKVTVVVSQELELQEVVVPAIPTKPSAG